MKYKANKKYIIDYCRVNNYEVASFLRQCNMSKNLIGKIMREESVSMATICKIVSKIGNVGFKDVAHFIE